MPQVLGLGFTQTIAWASSTYLPAILAEPISRELGIARSTVFAAYSVSLVLMALAGPAVGRAIDRHGGRGMLAGSSVVLAAGLVVLGLAPDTLTMFAAWLVLGIGMAMGLYDAAFAALVRIHGDNARGPITGITLIAGFASTVGWPLSAFLNEHYDWRIACFCWAALHIALTLPANLLLIPSVKSHPRPGAKQKPVNAASAVPKADRAAFMLVALWAAGTAFVTSAFAAHLPGLLMATGVGAVTALAASAMLGPSQVAARLAEFLASKRIRFHPLISARVATSMHPVGALLLGGIGGLPVTAALFAILHGAGNGMITIARGTLPLALFGPTDYGYRQGLLSMLARGMQAIAPFAFGLVLERGGAGWALALSGGVSMLAFIALLALRARPRAD